MTGSEKFTAGQRLRRIDEPDVTGTCLGYRENQWGKTYLWWRRDVPRDPHTIETKLEENEVEPIPDQPTASAEARELVERHVFNDFVDVACDDQLLAEQIKAWYAALESRVARLTEERDSSRAHAERLVLEGDSMEQQRDAATKRAEELAKELSQIKESCWGMGVDTAEPSIAVQVRKAILSAAHNAKHSTECEMWTRVNEAKDRAEETKALLDSFTAELAETDTAIRDLCRPFLTERTCDHDWYAVVPMVGVVSNAIEALKKRADTAEALVREVAECNTVIHESERSSRAACIVCKKISDGLTLDGLKHTSDCIVAKCRAFAQEGGA